MAIGRLLSPKLNPHFSSRGFVPLTKRWFSSSLEDARKFEKLPDSKASTNKDTGKNWYSLGGLLTNLKEKITGNMLVFKTTPGEEDSVSPKSPGDVVTATKVVSLLEDVAENKNCIPLSLKEQSLGSQEATQSVDGVEISEKRESMSTDKERLDCNGLGASGFAAQEKVLRSVQAERVGLLEEPSSKGASLGLLTEEASKSKGKLQPERGPSVQKKPTQNKLSNMFINMDQDKEVKLHPRFEALSKCDSSMFTGESGSDPHDLVGKMVFDDPVQTNQNISKEIDKDRFSDHDSLASLLRRAGSHDQKIGDLDAIRERKSTFSFEISKKLVVDEVVSRDLGMKELIDSSHNRSTDNGTDENGILGNGNGVEGKRISKEETSVTGESDGFLAREEEESKEEALVLQKRTSCTQDTTLATTTAESLEAFSVGEEHPLNRVVLRFLKDTVEKKEIVEVLSVFGDVSDVQEIPSVKGCMFKDALVTFETNAAVKKALEEGVVILRCHSVVVEATSQEDMVEERIHIPALIGDPDVPIALVKEPIRTVKIHPLAHDISSNQIKDALRFCRSDVSKLIFGSSKTAAFVEFETENGKERALAGHSVNIFNKKLFISRIDTPRTTVARISNFSMLAMEEIRKVCVLYGRVKRVVPRGKGVVDVYFDASEWPNMVTILNSLNGREVDGMKWLARPAPVIPPEIIKVLWEDPQEKRYVKGLIQNLVKEIGQPLDVTRSYALVTDL